MNAGATTTGAWRYFGRILESLTQYGILRILPLAFYEIACEARFRSGTGRAVHLEELDLSRDQQEHGNMYVPCPYLFLYQAFAVIGDELRETTIIDYGCGLGRILLYATGYPFQRIIGIEVSDSLCAEASRCLERYYAQNHRTTPPWSVVNRDATTFDVPDDASVFFFNDPFDASVMNRVLGNISASQKRRPRRLFAIYVNPGHPKVFPEHGYDLIESTVNANNKGFMVFKWDG